MIGMDWNDWYTVREFDVGRPQKIPGGDGVTSWGYLAAVVVFELIGSI